MSQYTIELSSGHRLATTTRAARWKSTRPGLPNPAALLARRRPMAYVLHHAAKPRKTAKNRAKPRSLAADRARARPGDVRGGRANTALGHFRIFVKNTQTTLLDSGRRSAHFRQNKRNTAGFKHHARTARVGSTHSHGGWRSTRPTRRLRPLFSRDVGPGRTSYIMPQNRATVLAASVAPLPAPMAL